MNARKKGNGSRLYASLRAMSCLMEIGGLFEFPEYSAVTPSESVFRHLFSDGKESYRTQFIRDGRQAIKTCILSSGFRNQVHSCYLPSYLCRSVLQPFSELNLPVLFYPHDPPLKPVIDASLKNSLIVIIDTFGIPFLSDREILELSRDNIVILDISHSIFHRQRRMLVSDRILLVSSLRKVFPIPDGGVIFHTDTCEKITGLNPPIGYEAILESMYLKKYYLFRRSKGKDCDLKNAYLALYNKYGSEKSKPSGSLQAIPEISLDILRNLSYKEIVKRRSANLGFILDRVDRSLHFIDQKKIKSPFFAPILCGDNETRERIRQSLIEREIYPPIHWSLPAEIPKDYRYELDLSDRILSIPVDQRYTPTDLRYIPEIINSHIHG